MSCSQSECMFCTKFYAGIFGNGIGLRSPVWLDWILSNKKICVILFECFKDRYWIETSQSGYLALYNNELLPNSIKRYQGRFTILPNISKNCNRLIKFRQSGKIWPNLVTLWTCNLFLSHTHSLSLMSHEPLSQSVSLPLSHTHTSTHSRGHFNTHLYMYLALTLSVTRLGVLFNFGQLFKAFGNN